MADRIKWLASALVLAAGVIAFYTYADASFLMRVVGVVVSTIVAAVIAVQTERGRAAWHFVRTSVTEVRKVVWPNRRETGQTTLLVIVMVIIFGIIMWLFDMFLMWAVRLLTGQGG